MKWFSDRLGNEVQNYLFFPENKLNYKNEEDGISSASLRTLFSPPPSHLIHTCKYGYSGRIYESFPHCVKFSAVFLLYYKFNINYYNSSATCLPVIQRDVLAFILENGVGTFLPPQDAQPAVRYPSM